MRFSFFRLFDTLVNVDWNLNGNLSNFTPLDPVISRQFPFPGDTRTLCSNFGGEALSLSGKSPIRSRICYLSGAKFSANFY